MSQHGEVLEARVAVLEERERTLSALRAQLHADRDAFEREVNLFVAPLEQSEAKLHDQTHKVAAQHTHDDSAHTHAPRRLQLSTHMTTQDTHALRRLHSARTRGLSTHTRTARARAQCQSARRNQR